MVTVEPSPSPCGAIHTVTMYSAYLCAKRRMVTVVTVQKGILS
jgi:hypothetical protein